MVNLGLGTRALPLQLNPNHIVSNTTVLKKSILPGLLVEINIQFNVEKRIQIHLISI